MNIQDAKTIEAMIAHGGSFVRALGLAALRADSDNLERIKTAFPEYWKKYLEWSEGKIRQ